jgi:hypothetical protein
LFDPYGKQKKKENDDKAQHERKPSTRYQNRSGIIVDEGKGKHPQKGGQDKFLKRHLGQPSSVTDDVEGNEGKKPGQEYDLCQKLIRASTA